MKPKTKRIPWSAAEDEYILLMWSWANGGFLRYNQLSFNVNRDFHDGKSVRNAQSLRRRETKLLQPKNKMNIIGIQSHHEKPSHKFLGYCAILESGKKVYLPYGSENIRWEGAIFNQEKKQIEYHGKALCKTVTLKKMVKSWSEHYKNYRGND